MFPELPEELRPRRRSLVAGELGPEGLHERRRASPRYAEELLDVAAREEGPVELFELSDRVWDGEEAPGAWPAPHRCRQSRRGRAPSGRRALVGLESEPMNALGRAERLKAAK